MATSDVIRTDYVLPLKTSARSDLSQSTYADMVDADTTPPTSSSGLSSQDNVLHAGQPRAQTKPLEPTSMGIYTQRLEQPSLTSAGVNNGVVSKSHANSLSQGGSEKAAQGQKRTASGEVKQSNDGGSGSRDTSGIRGHSRTTSTASNGNRIAELSSQLRARLSYAASIVEKNWQSRDANGKDGASTRYSQSPARSRTSSQDLGDVYFSPRNEAVRSRMSYLNGSPEKVPPYASNSTSPRKPIPLNGPARISSSISADIASLTRSSSQPENKSTFPGEVPNLNKNPRRTLAPPADIVTGENRARRRPNPNANLQASRPNVSPNRQHQNAQQGKHQALPHNRSNSVNSIVPGTPPPSYNPQPSSSQQYSTPAGVSAKGRTPSQNAIMEQDAIETLLFMSSPGNSGYHPSTSSQNSQPQQQSQNREHNTLNQALSSSSMPPPPPMSEVGLGIANAPGLDPDKTPTQTPQNQRPVRRVSFVDSNHSEGTTGTTQFHDLLFQPTHDGSFRFEDQAGDEIDRLLDQMVEEDSDSDDYFIRNSQAWIQGGKEGVLGNNSNNHANGT